MAAFHTGEYQCFGNNFECLDGVHLNVNRTIAMIDWVYLRVRWNLCVGTRTWFRIGFNIDTTQQETTCKAISASMMHTNNG